MKSNQPLRILMLTAVAAFVLSACGEPEALQGQAPSAPKVDVAQVLHERVTEWDEFTGRLQAPESVTLVPRVSGYIESVNFKEGALVKKGDVLFRIDASVFEAEVARLKADLASALSAEQLATNDLERARKLFAQKAVSAELLDTRESNKRQTTAAVASVKAALLRAELDLDYTQVRAPIDGRASYANVTAGNYVSAGQSVLTSLVSTASMYAYFDVDEQTYLKYVKLTAEKKRKDPRAGDNPVYMALANEREYQHIGLVDFVDNSMDRQTGTIRVRATFSNEDNSLLPGLFARLRTAGSGAYDGILIDDKAVGTDLNNKFVLVVANDGTVEYRGVTLGEKVQGLRIIKQGLAANDKIVVNGMQRVRPKMQIEPHLVDMADSEQLDALRQAQLLLDKHQENITTPDVEVASRG
ncbi:efflux RND transporter periplasmic adaptor subunit [Shewanella decolorationis]|uniref:Efflux RND transporter periplasmic adaptor subunit n=1 Tax=Shewanella decolorationis TaxID=256839 RepID=A0A5B8R2C5_9GAMM|nr:efflux RND transporter periplasmic adaptor subunit [Shewanella decolorationis]QDZ91991.1 efflux RND transporter periplasmic adaptor subunit [Shewanella decolorationis]